MTPPPQQQQQQQHHQDYDERKQYEQRGGEQGGYGPRKQVRAFWQNYRADNKLNHNLKITLIYEVEDECIVGFFYLGGYPSSR